MPSAVPHQLHRVALQQQAGVRFDDVDFRRHNRTRFVGLENDIANCYANSLLQVGTHISLCEAEVHHVCCYCLELGSSMLMQAQIFA